MRGAAFGPPLRVPADFRRRGRVGSLRHGFLATRSRCPAHPRPRPDLGRVLGRRELDRRLSDHRRAQAQESAERLRDERRSLLPDRRDSQRRGRGQERRAQEGERLRDRGAEGRGRRGRTCALRAGLQAPGPVRAEAARRAAEEQALAPIRRRVRLRAVATKREPRLVSLGYGRFVRADRIYALVPLGPEERGEGRRTYVHVEGLSEPLVASRSEKAILADVEAALTEAAGIPRRRRTAKGQETLL